VIEDRPLARFVDRQTMVYERTYPHDIELVWEAVSTGEHLDVWMLPESRVERRLGGACAFGWGSSADEPHATRSTITVWEPPRAVQYTTDDDGSYMRFDLTPEGDATRLLFTLYFVSGDPTPEDAYPGADKPAGPDTAWRPGFLSGYHGFLDDLAAFLRGEWTREDRMASLEHMETDEFLERIERYRQHVREHCPPA
jgi:uncharacterized protein YndB with AHSA1/START domain